MIQLKSLRNLFFEKKGLSHLLILFAFGVVLLLFGGTFGTSRQTEPIAADREVGAATEELEQKLAETLSRIQGVGKVKVMITLEDNGSSELATDMQNTNRGEETDFEQKTVIVNGNGGTAPYVVREKSARVKGVLVVAEGGGNPTVRETVENAVTALLSVLPHRVTVAEMANSPAK